MSGALGAALIALAAATPASAQVKPKVTESGVEHPHSAIYIGNSFFYYNNSLHNHVTQLIRAADPAYRFRSTSVTISRLGLRLARRRLVLPAQCDRTLFVQHQERHRVQQDRSAVRSRDHDGLQPVPGASAAAAGVLRADEAARRHRAQIRHQAGVLHVMGLCRRAGDDGATGRGLHHAPPTTATPSSSRPGSPSLTPSSGGRRSISMSPTSGTRASRAPISPPRRPTARCSGNPRSG